MKSVRRGSAREAGERWPRCALAIHHRIGRVEIGEASVVIAAASRAPRRRVRRVPLRDRARQADRADLEARALRGRRRLDRRRDGGSGRRSGARRRRRTRMHVTIRLFARLRELAGALRAAPRAAGRVDRRERPGTRSSASFRRWPTTNGRSRAPSTKTTRASRRSCRTATRSRSCRRYPAASTAWIDGRSAVSAHYG